MHTAADDDLNIQPFSQTGLKWLNCVVSTYLYFSTYLYKWHYYQYYTYYASNIRDKIKTLNEML